MIHNSVNLIDHSICTGCMMCSDICAKDAITFTYDTGFWYPSVDEAKCVNCGLCSLRCPALKDAPIVKGPVSCYGAITKDEKVRWQSTSGGFFSELATAVIKCGGVIVGAIYGNDNEIVHKVEYNEEGIAKLRQSKYAQSKTEGIFSQVKQELKLGKEILFTGTPCQVEALHSYLGKEYTNLLTMDFVCLGVCSPVVYRNYLNSLEQKYKSKVKKVWFKNKTAGWGSIGTRIEFESGKVYFQIGSLDPFMVAFVHDTISIRKSCESCKFRKIPHNSDITVADFWGIGKINPSFNDDKGVSAVIVNTEKGQFWFEKIKNNLSYFNTTVNSIIQGNFTAVKSKSAGKNRDAFLKSISTQPIQLAVKRYGTYLTLKKRVRIRLSLIKKKIFSWIKKQN